MLTYNLRVTDKVVGIKEAIRLGILDTDLSSYRNLHTNKLYTIQEAIDAGLLMATLDETDRPQANPTGIALLDSMCHLQVLPVRGCW